MLTYNRRFNSSRLDDRGNRGSRHGDRGNRDRQPRESRRKDDRQKSALTAEELDREMDSYMNSNVRIMIIDYIETITKKISQIVLGTKRGYRHDVRLNSLGLKRILLTIT